MRSDDDFIGPVNIGNPSEFTMIELAQMIREKTGCKSELVHKPLPVNDPMQRKPDISLAKEKLNWKPVIDLSSGLDRTIDYFKSRVEQQGLKKAA